MAAGFDDVVCKGRGISIGEFLRSSRMPRLVAGVLVCSMLLPAGTVNGQSTPEDGSVSSQPTEEFSVTLGQPVDVAVVALTGALEVTWGAPADADEAQELSYRVEYRSAGTEAWLLHAESTQSPAEIGDLANGTSYSVRVAAVSGSDTGEWSATVSGVPAVAPLPTPRLTAEAFRNETVHLSWRGATSGVEVVQFRIEYRPEGQDDWTLQGFQPGTLRFGSGVLVENVEGGVPHEFRVRAVGTAASSRWVTVTFTPEGIPGVPTDVTAKALGEDRVEVSWMAPEELKRPCRSRGRCRQRRGSVLDGA